MDEKEHIRVQLSYPLEHVKDPIIYHLVEDYKIIPNIRRANIDVRTGGNMVLELEGTHAGLEAAKAYLRALGITVSEVGADNSWSI